MSEGLTARGSAGFAEAAPVQQPPRHGQVRPTSRDRRAICRDAMESNAKERTAPPAGLDLVETS
jgi:hypothetical protein